MLSLAEALFFLSQAKEWSSEKVYDNVSCILECSRLALASCSVGHEVKLECLKWLSNLVVFVPSFELEDGVLKPLMSETADYLERIYDELEEAQAGIRTQLFFIINSLLENMKNVLMSIMKIKTFWVGEVLSLTIILPRILSRAFKVLEDTIQLSESPLPKAKQVLSTFLELSESFQVWYSSDDDVDIFKLMTSELLSFKDVLIKIDINLMIDVWRCLNKLQMKNKDIFSAKEHLEEVNDVLCKEVCKSLVREVQLEKNEEVGKKEMDLKATEAGNLEVAEEIGNKKEDEFDSVDHRCHPESTFQESETSSPFQVASNVMQSNWIASPGAVIITIPHTPHLSPRCRNRPVAVLSREEKGEREEQEFKEQKAKKYNTKGVGETVDVERKACTVSQPFHLTNNGRPGAPVQPQQDESAQAFQALPVPKGLMAAPLGVPERKIMPVIEPQSSTFVLKGRMADMKLKFEPDPDPEPRVKARPASHCGVPVALPPHWKRSTVAEPFSFECKDQITIEKKEEKIKQIYEEKKKAREFHAKPIMKENAVKIPVIKFVTPFNPAPFKLQTDASVEVSLSKWQDDVEEELEKQKSKAHEPKVQDKAPFMPLRDISNFALFLDRRADVEAFGLKVKQREVDIEGAKREEEVVRRNREDEEEVAKLRISAVPKPVEVKPSDKPLNTFFILADSFPVSPLNVPDIKSLPDDMLKKSPPDLKNCHPIPGAFGSFFILSSLSPLGNVDKSVPRTAGGKSKKPKAKKKSKTQGKKLKKKMKVPGFEQKVLKSKLINKNLQLQRCVNTKRFKSLIEVENGIYKCIKCKLETGMKSRAWSHASRCGIQRKNAPKKPTKRTCKSCFKDFFSKRKLVQHFRTEHQKLKYICAQCSVPKTFKFRFSLLRHVALKHKKSGQMPSFKCEYCCYGASQKVNLKRHIRRHHKSVNIVSTLLDNVVDEAVEVSGLCEWERIRHKNIRKNRELLETLFPPEIPIRKPIKKKKVSNLNHELKMRRSVRLASEPDPCDGSGVQASPQLHLHVLPNPSATSQTFVETSRAIQEVPQVDENTGKLLQCHLCSFKTAHKHSLARHNMKKHKALGEKLPCPRSFCKLTFATRGEKEDHVTQCFLVCNQEPCEFKKFARPDKYKKHLRMHQRKLEKLEE